MSSEPASGASTGLADAESDGVAAALVDPGVVGAAASDGATVGAACALAAAESFVSSGLAVPGARLPDGVAVGFGVAGGLEEGLTVGLA